MKKPELILKALFALIGWKMPRQKAPYKKHPHLADVFYYQLIIFSPVRQHTRAAILAAVRKKRKVAAAFLSQAVQRAEAEKAVKVTFVVSLVAGKILAGCVAEIGVVFVFTVTIFIRHFLSSKSVFCTLLIRLSVHISPLCVQAFREVAEK